jgi:hypothetical protein
LGIAVSAAVAILSARANREAQRTGALRFFFWHIRGWGERDTDPSFFRLALSFYRSRTVFFALLSILFGAYLLEALGLLH